MASTPGPRELALRAQREAAAKGSPRKAAPARLAEAKAVLAEKVVRPVDFERNTPRKGGDGKRAGPAKASGPPPAGDGVQFVPVTLSLSPGLIDRLDEDAHGHRETRSAAARRLLEEGLK